MGSLPCSRFCLVTGRSSPSPWGGSLRDETKSAAWETIQKARTGYSGHSASSHRSFQVMNTCKAREYNLRVLNIGKNGIQLWEKKWEKCYSSKCFESLLLEPSAGK